MGDSIILLLLLQILLIALNAVFASAEIAVLSLNETKLERMAQQGNRRARRLFRLTREPARFLATIQVAITLSGFLGSAFAAENFSDPLVNWVIGLGVGVPRRTLDAATVVLITLILSYFTLIFGELVPKRVAMKKSEQIALGVSGVIGGISVLFKPVVSFLSLSTNAVLRLMGIAPEETQEQVGEEEIRMMVDAGSEKGTIGHQEKEFIQNVFEFNDITAGDIATHRTDVAALWLEDGEEVWAKTIRESRHTLFPVCDGSPDQVTGVLNAKDYFRLEKKSREEVLAKAVHPAYFVPETIKADVLFRNMKRTRNRMAVILDEYGGMVGVATYNDLIEALVGDLDDEPEGAHSGEPRIARADEKTWVLTGNVELRDIEEATGLRLESDEYDTFTGLVFDALGAVPCDGEQAIDLELPNMTVHVSRVREHQIQEAVLRLRPAQTESLPG